MRNYTKLAVFSAIALFGFSACNVQEDPIAGQDNPNYIPEENAVKTKFIVSLDTQSSAQTKTLEKYTQNDGKFLGMEMCHILTYDLGYDPASTVSSGKFYFNPSAAGAASTKDYDVNALFNGTDEDTDFRARTIELALPLETNAVVFYGKARNNAGPDYQGKLIIDGDASDLRTLMYKLAPRCSSKQEFYVGAYIFSRIITDLLVAGKVREKKTNDNNPYWKYGTVFANSGDNADNRYKFWWSENEAKVVVAGTGFPASPSDGTEYTDASTSYKYTYHEGNMTWKMLGMMYDAENDGDGATSALTASLGMRGNGQGMNLSVLGETLGEAYSLFTTIREETVTVGGNPQTKALELRAGSAPAFLRTMRDLYAIVYKAKNSTPTGWEEEVVKEVAEDLHTRFNRYFDLSTPLAIEFRSADNIRAAIQERTSAQDPSDWTGTYNDHLATDTDGATSNAGALVTKYFNDTYLEKGAYVGKSFPINLGLPYGGSEISCTKKEEANQIDLYDYIENVPAYGMGSATFNIFRYTYAAELLYYGNSAIRTSDTPLDKDQYPDNFTNWTNDDFTLWKSNGWNMNGTVKSTTRSVAMVNPINYGTALFKSNIKYKTDVTYLYDNNQHFHSAEPDNQIQVTGTGATGGLQVTGVVIGGQPREVGWDYTRKAVSNQNWNAVTYNKDTKVFEGISFGDNSMDYNIFDKVVNPFTITKTDNNVFSLVFDNYNHLLAADAQADVYIALELVNNTGKDFWGEHNLVRQGGVFYLVGKLDLTKLKSSNPTQAAQAGNPSTIPTQLKRDHYFYPPFNPETGETIEAPRVFMQDYMTTATLWLGSDCLKHAYVTVPDLRSNQVSLGLSIDTKWETGMSFDVEMGNI